MVGNDKLFLKEQFISRNKREEGGKEIKDSNEEFLNFISVLSIS